MLCHHMLFTLHRHNTSSRFVMAVLFKYALEPHVCNFIDNCCLSLSFYGATGTSRETPICRWRWSTMKAHVVMHRGANIWWMTITRAAYINSLRPSDAYMRRWSNQHGFRYWLGAWSAPSHYQNQCWNIVNKTLRGKRQWNFNQNSNIFIQENAFESVVCEKAAILFRPQ